ncbi:HXXEE domain-containing protein [Microbispora sp. NPDC088329]|uniref:HXXEE domain-containing protein n=1 Tax=Microbispora sp. NPDC088329 TaxID=3154869 RepID=UPI00342ABB7F
MKSFIARHNLYLLTALSAAALLYTLVSWSSLPVPQRMVGLFSFALVLHLWEEGRFPGGFTAMITDKLGFAARSPHFGEIITATYVLFIAFVPLLLPNVAFLAIAPMMLGILEAIAHTAAIKMFDLKRFYSPGLITAGLLLLPLSLSAIIHTAQHDLLQPAEWLYAFLYMLAGLALAQQIVVREAPVRNAL